MSDGEGNPTAGSDSFSDALDRILSRVPVGEPADPTTPDPALPDPGDLGLPEIVPATPDPDPAPSLPSRAPSATTAATPDPVLPATQATPATPSLQAPAAPVAAAPSPVRQIPTTGWSDHMAVPSSAGGPALRAPGRRPRVRRVTRVVRHVDPWSAFKLALTFSLVGYLVALTSGVLLWRVADATGTIDNVERWFTQFGWETFEFDGRKIFHNAWIIGLFLAVGLTGMAVLLVTLFNLVSDIVGGVRVTVLEEEVVERTASSTRRYVVRRPPLASGSATDWDPEPVGAAPASAVSQTWSVDD